MPKRSPFDKGDNELKLKVKEEFKKMCSMKCESYDSLYRLIFDCLKNCNNPRYVCEFIKDSYSERISEVKESLDNFFNISTLSSFLEEFLFLRKGFVFALYDMYAGGNIPFSAHIFHELLRRNFLDHFFQRIKDFAYKTTREECFDNSGTNLRYVAVILSTITFINDKEMRDDFLDIIVKGIFETVKEGDFLNGDDHNLTMSLITLLMVIKKKVSEWLDHIFSSLTKLHRDTCIDYILEKLCRSVHEYFILHESDFKMGQRLIVPDNMGTLVDLLTELKGLDDTLGYYFVKFCDEIYSEFQGVINTGDSTQLFGFLNYRFKEFYHCFDKILKALRRSSRYKYKSKDLIRRLRPLFNDNVTLSIIQLIVSSNFSRDIFPYVSFLTNCIDNKSFLNYAIIHKIILRMMEKSDWDNPNYSELCGIVGVPCEMFHYKELTKSFANKGDRFKNNNHIFFSEKSFQREGVKEISCRMHPSLEERYKDGIYNIRHLKSTHVIYFSWVKLSIRIGENKYCVESDAIIASIILYLSDGPKTVQDLSKIMEIEESRLINYYLKKKMNKLIEFISENEFKLKEPKRSSLRIITDLWKNKRLQNTRDIQNQERLKRGIERSIKLKAGKEGLTEQQIIDNVKENLRFQVTDEEIIEMLKRISTKYEVINGVYYLTKQ